MFLHAQCICYIIAILLMTGLGFRSGFLLLIALVFYTLTTIINLISGLMLRGNIITHLLQRNWNLELNHLILCRWSMDCHPFHWSNLSVWIFSLQCTDNADTSYTGSRTSWSLNESWYVCWRCCHSVGNFIGRPHCTGFMRISTTMCGHVWISGCFRCLCHTDGNTDWFSVPLWRHTATILDLCELPTETINGCSSTWNYNS